MKFTLTIELGNEEMRTRCNVEESLRNLGQNLAYMSEIPDFGDEGDIRDINGNVVGKWEVLP